MLNIVDFYNCIGIELCGVLTVLIGIWWKLFRVLMKFNAKLKNAMFALLEAKKSHCLLFSIDYNSYSSQELQTICLHFAVYKGKLHRKLMVKVSQRKCTIEL